jgi:V/A-type H+-transporting ATPase subunit K
MYFLISLMTLGILGMIVAGLFLEFRPADAPGQRHPNRHRWYRPALISNLLLFIGAQVALMTLGIQDVMAQPSVAEAMATGEISNGLGLALIGIGIPTALSTVGAGIAVGPIGAASLAALAEKPEMFGRTLIYLGLAEGIAIYGLVMSILLLDKI